MQGTCGTAEIKYISKQDIIMEIKKYKKESQYSYTLGAFPTLELVEAMPEKVIEILIHPDFSDKELVTDKCRKACGSGSLDRQIAVGKDGKPNGQITVREDGRLIDRLSDKENVYVVGIFDKYKCSLKTGRPHIVLVNPSNMGNLGTIIRTACGFGIEDIAIIGNGADHFNPKVVRASMGAIFRERIECFDDFDAYRSVYNEPGREIFTFMLNGEKPLRVGDIPKPELFSLVFGNEATGLPDEYLDYGTSIIIPQTEYVDSLNLTIAAGIGMYCFCHL